MGKYRLVRNGVDDYSLFYKDKEIKFHSDVGVITDLQMVYSTAEETMIIELAKKNMTVNDLVKTYKKDGKTFVDYSSKDALKKVYVEKESSRLLNEAVVKCLGISLNALLADMELTELTEAETFCKEIGAAIAGRFRGEGQDKVDK